MPILIAGDASILAHGLSRSPGSGVECSADTVPAEHAGRGCVALPAISAQRQAGQLECHSWMERGGLLSGV